MYTQLACFFKEPERINLFGGFVICVTIFRKSKQTHRFQHARSIEWRFLVFLSSHNTGGLKHFCFQLGISQSELTNSYFLDGLFSTCFNHQSDNIYPLLIKHGGLENPRTEWRFFQRKIPMVSMVYFPDMCDDTGGYPSFCHGCATFCGPQMEELPGCRSQAVSVDIFELRHAG